MAQAAELTFILETNMPGLRLCSIVVTCFNKADFVGHSIDSALRQTYPNIEVIVVNDGSTDGSADALRQYSGLITVIEKSNGGQGSAMNRGFAACRGDIVFFLDGDDLLDPTTVERVAAIWTPGTSKVHFRLRIIRDDGATIAGAYMPPYRPLLARDVGPTFRRFGFYPSPPMSGNAFGRHLLDVVMPLPESVYRGSADTPLIGLAPLFGQVVALAGVAGSYRKGATNVSHSGLGKLERNLAGRAHYVATARALAGTDLPKRFRAQWPQHLKEKLIVTKFSPSPSRRNGGMVVAIALFWAVLRWPEYTLANRVMFAMWTIGIVMIPAVLLKRIPGVVGYWTRLA